MKDVKIEKDEKAKLERNVAITSLQGVFEGISMRMYMIIWQPFVLTFKSSMSFVGALNVLGGRTGFVSSISQLLIAPLSDRFGRKPVIAFCQLMSFLGFLTLAFTFKWYMLIPAFILLGLSTSRIPARGALLAESVKPTRRGIAFSVYMLPFTAAGVVAPILVAFIHPLLGYRFLFVLCALLLLASTVITVYGLRETHLNRRKTSFLSLVKAILKRSDLRAFFTMGTLDLFGWGVGFSVIYGILSRELGYAPKELAILSLVQNCVAIFSQIPIGKLVDLYGRKVFLLASELLATISMLGFALFKSLRFLMVFFGFIGLSVACWFPAAQSWLADQTGQSERGGIMGVINAMRSLASLPAPILGGLLYDVFGYQAPFLVGFAFLCAASLLIVFLLPRSRVSNQLRVW